MASEIADADKPLVEAKKLLKKRSQPTRFVNRKKVEEEAEE